MDELRLFLRVIVSIIFISSAYSKLSNLQAHITAISNYQVTPINWSKRLALTDGLFELLTGILFLIGYLQSLSLFMLSVLLTIYCVAIGINLKRGRRELSCGCGGVVGEHKISWYLVFRNIILLIIIFFVFNNGSNMFSLDNYFLNTFTLNYYFYYESLIIIFSSCVSILIYSSIQGFLKVRKNII